MLSPRDFHWCRQTNQHILSTFIRSCSLISVAGRDFYDYFSFILISMHFYYYIFIFIFRCEHWCFFHFEDGLIYVFIPFCLNYKGSVCPSSLYISLSCCILSLLAGGGGWEGCLQPATQCLQILSLFYFIATFIRASLGDTPCGPPPVLFSHCFVPTWLGRTSKASTVWFGWPSGNANDTATTWERWLLKFLLVTEVQNTIFQI